jgi:hypothetical protein
MANNAEVRTRLHMRPALVSEVLATLNRSHFGGIMVITNEDNYWHVGCTVADVCYVSRQMWLERPRMLTMRHGGRGTFDWWVDHSITNALAVRFKGSVVDDSAGKPEPGDPNKYPTFTDYLRMYWSHVDPKLRDDMLRREIPMTPPQFRAQIPFR